MPCFNLKNLNNSTLADEMHEMIAALTSTGRLSPNQMVSLFLGQIITNLTPNRQGLKHPAQTVFVKPQDPTTIVVNGIATNSRVKVTNAAMIEVECTSKNGEPVKALSDTTQEYCSDKISIYLGKRQENFGMAIGWITNAIITHEIETSLDQED